MLRVFGDAGFDVTRRLAEGTVELEFPIAAGEAYRARVDERDHAAVVASLQPVLRDPRAWRCSARRRVRGSIGGELFRNIVEGGFAGAAYPVNRSGAAVAGVDGYASIEEVPERVDLAVICLPAEVVLEAAETALAPGRARALRRLGRLRRAGARGRRAAGSPAGARPRARRPAGRPELPGDRQLRPPA